MFDVQDKSNINDNIFQAINKYQYMNTVNNKNLKKKVIKINKQINNQIVK